MGASTVVTQTILFIAVLTIATGLIIGIKNFSDKTESSLNTQSNAYNELIKTDISIDVVHYDNTTNITTIYARNTGKTKIDPEKVDVWIDGIRIARNTSIRNISVEPDTDRINKGIWDSKEILKITIRKDLNKDEIHEAIVMTPNSVKDSDVFSV